MLNVRKFALVMLLSSMSGAAIADDRGVTAAFKLGKLHVDGFDEGNGLGLSVGYYLGGNFSVEFDTLTGDTDGVDIDSKALYGAFRSEGKGYLMFKMGVINEEVKACGPFNCASESDTGFSLGFGGGFRFKDEAFLEVEHIVIEDRVDFIGVGARFKF